MEAKVHDRKMDILSALRELKRMIAAGSIRWYSAKNSSTLACDALLPYLRFD